MKHLSKDLQSSITNVLPAKQDCVKDDNRAMLLYVPLAMYKSCPDATDELNCIVFHFMLCSEIRVEGVEWKT